MDKFLREIEPLIIKPYKKILKGGKGNYKAGGFGNSLDFYGHRKYMPGDDVRKIDWKAYMRTDEFYIKEFGEQKNMNVNIILDISSSMDFGNPNKFEIGKTLSVGISYLTLKQMDNLSIYTLNDKLNCNFKGIRGKDNFYNIMEDINNLNSSGKTNLKDILNLNNSSSGITFIISDFFDEDIETALDYLITKGQEVVMIHLLSPSEINPDYNRELKLIDKESGNIVRLSFDKNIKQKYINKIEKFISNIKEKCSQREIKYIFAQTDTTPVNILSKSLGGI